MTAGQIHAHAAMGGCLVYPGTGKQLVIGDCASAGATGWALNNVTQLRRERGRQAEACPAQPVSPRLMAVLSNPVYQEHAFPQMTQNAEPSDAAAAYVTVELEPDVSDDLLSCL